MGRLDKTRGGRPGGLPPLQSARAGLVQCALLGSGDAVALPAAAVGRTCWPSTRNTGDIAWRVPLGTSDELEAKGIHNTGAFGQGGPIATAGGLVFIAGTIDKRFRAFDSRTGKLLWETKLDSRRPHQPHDLHGRNGKQYVVIVSSGVNAFALN